MKPPDYLRYLYLLLALVLPWSADAPVWGQSQILFPAELLIGVIGLVLLKYIRPADFSRQYLPVFLCLAWGWVCTIFSSAPIVSSKYMVVATACWWVFFIPSVRWRFVIEEALPVFSVSMAVAALRIVLVHGLLYQFRNDQANLPAMPFFDDQNLSAALLCMLAFVIWVPKQNLGNWKWVRVAIFVILTVGIAFSTSRGAWLSVISGGLLVAQLMYFNNRPLVKTLFISGVFVVLGGWLTADGWVKKLQQDVSMQERCNRYACALKMAEKRPVFGFGPGTFAVAYLPFQEPENMTRISLNKPITKKGPENYGHGGGAHSEYLQVLSETGWPGLVFFCLFWGILLKKAADGIKFESTKLTAVLLLGALFTFMVHGLVNNFFHDPRIAFIFWICTGKLFFLTSGETLLKEKTG